MSAEAGKYADTPVFVKSHGNVPVMPFAPALADVFYVVKNPYFIGLGKFCDSRHNLALRSSLADAF